VAALLRRRRGQTHRNTGEKDAIRARLYRRRRDAGGASSGEPGAHGRRQG